MGAPQLYLVARIDEAAATAGLERLKAVLGAALAAGPVSSVLLAPSTPDLLAPPLVKALVELIQIKNAAALIADDATLARTLKADGVHLAWSKDQLARYSEAREILGARFIVGVDAGRSRDVAMSLGEDGADYIAFGIPPHVEDRETAFARQLELISWWSEIFEPPCVAFDVADDAAAFDLAAANADFVALAIDLSQPPEEAARRVKDFGAARVAANATA